MLEGPERGARGSEKSVYQEGAKKDERNEVDVGQIGAALLVFDDHAVFELETARVARSAFDAREHDIRPSLARGASSHKHRKSWMKQKQRYAHDSDGFKKKMEGLGCGVGWLGVGWRDGVHSRCDRLHSLEGGSRQETERQTDRVRGHLNQRKEMEIIKRRKERKEFVKKNPSTR